jgi:hypothetical protein
MSLIMFCKKYNLILIIISSIIIIPEIFLVHPYLHDTTGWIYPIRKWFVREIHSGILPLWVNITRYGWATTELQSTAWVWSPVAFVIGIFTPNYDSAMLNVEFLTWRLLAVSGTYVWIGRHVTPFFAGLAALTYIYSLHFIDLEKQITIYIGYALIPWVLFCVEGLFADRSRTGALRIAGILLVAMGWSAYPGVWIVCAAPILGYAATLAARLPRVPWTHTHILNTVACVLIAITGLAPLLLRLATSGLFAGGLRASIDWSPDYGALSDAAVLPCLIGSWGRALGIPPQDCLGEYSTVGLVATFVVVINRSKLFQQTVTQLSALLACAIITYCIATENNIGIYVRANIPFLYQVRWYSIHVNLIILIIVCFYAIMFDASAKVVGNAQWTRVALARFRAHAPRLSTPALVRAAAGLVQVGIMVAMFARSVPITGYAWREADTWDWSRRADRAMETYQADYLRDPLRRLRIDIDRNILNLLADVPHITYYRGLLPELETVDRYWGSPTLFESFLVLPLEWHVASETDITVGREAMRGDKTPRYDPAGWGERLCVGTDSPSQDVRRLTTYHSTIIEGHIETPCSGLAVWMDTYDEGWRVWVNGRRETLYRVNGAVRGFLIAPGDNGFVMEYRATVAAWRRMKLLVRAIFPGLSAPATA